MIMRVQSFSSSQFCLNASSLNKSSLQQCIVTAAPSRGRILFKRGTPTRAASNRNVSPSRWSADSVPESLLDVKSATPVPPREAILCQRLRAHSAALTAVLILDDTDACKQVVTASLDKTAALWRVEECSCFRDDEDETKPGGIKEVVRLEMPGAPIFSLALDPSSTNTGRQQVFAGNRDRTVVAWEPPKDALEETVALTGHTGWVRALATCGQWLFSGSCSTLRQWDMSRAVPRLLRDVKLDKGDIQSLTAGNNSVYACSADGSIQAWTVDKRTGALALSHSEPKAHSDRITASRWLGNYLYTVGYDGSLKMWDHQLQLVSAVKAAHDTHEGSARRIHCITVGSDGHIYTGGDDKLIRRWRAGVSGAGLLAPAAPPLYCHHYPVRVLAGGSNGTLVSGDSNGEVAVWSI